MNIPKGSLRFLWVVLVVSFAFSSDAAEPKRGGILRFGVSKNLTTLNPFVRMQSVDHRVRSLIYEGLLAPDKNLDPLPALATSWEVSSDGLTYTFTLRSGIRFHNGKSLHPADIKWSIEYAQDPKNGAFGRADLSIIERVDAEEPARIRIRLKSPFAPFLAAMSGIHLFPVVPKDSLQQAESKRETLPPGTGPFAFASWKSGQELTLTRSDSYWQKGLPYLDEIRFRIVPDDTVRLTGVRAGDLEIAEEIPMDQIQAIRQGKLPGIGLVLAEAGNHPRMGINHCIPPFNNGKVRQAMASVIDKQEILDGAFWGLGVPTNQKLLKGTKWFAAEVQDRKQDASRAKALLAEAGYPEGLKVTVSGWTGTEKVLQIVQSQARKAGIEMTIVIRDYVTQQLSHVDPIRMSGGSTGSDPDLAYYGYYHTPPPEQRQLGGRTQPCYTNPRVDRILEEARKVTDFRERRRMYKELIEILQEDVADIPLGFVPNGYAFQSHVRDFQPTITSVYSYGNGGVLKTWLDK
jgi:peptide/nickel transport system substrate-binding protein